MKKEKKDHESEGEEGDDEESDQPTEATTEQEGTSQTTEQKTDVDETISSTSTQDFNREVVEKEFINLATHYQKISDSFANPNKRSATHEKETVGYPYVPNTYPAFNEDNYQGEDIFHVWPEILHW